MNAGHLIAQRYRLGRKLGEGGMGTVYQAEHVKTGRQLAVKVLEKRETLPPEVVERFEREARAPAEIKHPNVVEVIDAGTEPDGTPYIVMELLEGETLDDVVKRERVVQPPLLAAVMDQLLAGLDAMHARGFVHRDLKPANIFLVYEAGRPMRVKLLDFGIAKVLGEDSRTKSGYVIGTPAYMAPEQMRNARNATGKSDLWSVGVMLYEALAGYRPFRGETFGLLAMIAGPGEHVPLGQIAPYLPRPLTDLVDRLLSKDTARRPSSAAEVRAELVPLLAQCPPVHVLTPPRDEDPRADEPIGSSPTQRRERDPSWRDRDEVSPDGETARDDRGPEYSPVPARKRRTVVLAALGAIALTVGVVAVVQKLGAGGESGHGHTEITPTPASPVESNAELSGFLNRWIGTVSGAQGQSPLGGFYADAVRFRGSNGLAGPSAIQHYWARLFDAGGTFGVDWSRSTYREETPDLNAGVSAACINLTGATGRMVTVRAWATENVADRSADIGCARLEGVYLVRLRRVNGGYKICHETWSMRDGICASCPTAPACQNGGAQRP